MCKVIVLVALSLIGVSAATLSLATKDRFELQEVKDDTQPYVFSTDNKNVLIVHLDRFMGGFVEQILEEQPDLIERLSGFTWYPQTVSAGYNSIAGMPPVFGGYDYLPHAQNERGLPLVDLTTEAFRLLPLNFTKKGYQFNFVNPRGLGWTMEGDCRLLNDIKGVRCRHTPASVSQRWAQRLNMEVHHGSLDPESYIYILRRLGAMRGLPYFLKDQIYNNGKWQPSMMHAAGVTFREWAELKSLPDLTTTHSGKPQVNIVWNILPHEPYYIGTDCQPTETMVHRTKEELSAQGYSSLREFHHYHAAKCSLMLVADYFDSLKARKVYDNTRIVIVSDHGIVGGILDRSSRAIAGDTTGIIGVSTRSALWVKAEHARGPMSISETFMPGADVPRIVCEQIGGCTNPFLGDKPIERLGRHDPFVVTYTPWQFNKQERTRFKVLAQKELIGGKPYDKDAWRTIIEAQ